MEAALRTVIEIVTGEKVERLFDQADIKPVRGFDGVRMAEIKIEKVGPVPAILSHLVTDFEWLKGVTVKVGMAHGTANAIRVMQDIQEGGPLSQCHFIEFMACRAAASAAADSPFRPRRKSARRAPKPSTARTPPRSAQIARKRGRAAHLPRILQGRALQPQEPRTSAHALHGKGIGGALTDFARLTAQETFSRNDLVAILGAKDVERHRNYPPRPQRPFCSNNADRRSICAASSNLPTPAPAIAFIAASASPTRA